MKSAKAHGLASFTAISAFIFVFLKNAWVGEDAYIIFRSVEQLFAGNGPRWNPHERVQAFTSPLWYGVQSIFRLLSSDVFLNAIVASALMCLILLVVLHRLLRDSVRLLLAVMLLVCSSAFFDYTTSGLENPLAYVAIALFFLLYSRVAAMNWSHLGSATYFAIVFCFGLIILCRHDLSTLVLAPTAYVIWLYQKRLPRRICIAYLVLALLPLVLWTLFALLYYGSVVPNTFYAKLPANLVRSAMLRRGLAYLWVSLQYDPVTPLIVGAAVLLSWFSAKRSAAILGTGIAMNLAYIIYVGGDFMQGRFLSYAYLLAVLMLLTPGMLNDDIVRLPGRSWLAERASRLPSWTVVMLSACLLYAVFYPHTPLNSGLDYHNEAVVTGVDDERGYYFATSSLWQYVTNKKGIVFPDHAWSQTGYRFSAAPQKTRVMHCIGYFGYWAGTQKVIIDPLGLGDALLARLPASGWYGQVGHFCRGLPAGYQQSVLDNAAEIESSDLNEYYKKIRIVAQEEHLLTLERLRTIVALNLGLYNHLLGAPYAEEAPRVCFSQGPGILRLPETSPSSSHR